MAHNFGQNLQIALSRLADTTSRLVGTDEELSSTMFQYDHQACTWCCDCEIRKTCLGTAAHYWEAKGKSGQSLESVIYLLISKITE